MKVSIVRRVEALEGSLKPSQPESPPLDFGLLVESEREYFSRVMRVLRLKARELGYGDKSSSVGWFDLSGCDPGCDEEVRAECLEALILKSK